MDKEGEGRDAQGRRDVGEVDAEALFKKMDKLNKKARAKGAGFGLPSVPFRIPGLSSRNGLKIKVK